MRRSHSHAWHADGITALVLVCLLAGLAPCQLWGQAPVITTVAGSGTAGYGGDNGPATSAKLSLVPGGGVAVDRAGNLYIADSYNQRIRMVDTNGIITTMAGTGTAGYAGDNSPATSARFNYPIGVAVDGTGNLYIADFYNQRIRMIDPSGTITTIAGNGTAGYAGDNSPATSARLNYPTGVAVDGTGNLYIADSLNQRIRMVDTSGIITTIAGNGTAGYAGDNGPATSARLNHPNGVAVDGTGNLYIADSYNQRIRKLDTARGVITTVAGLGSAGFSGDGGLAINAKLFYPYGVAVDPAGNLYIADYSNQRVRTVDTSGVITTIAGNGTAGYAGDDGPATSAELNLPRGVAVESAGNLYIGDTYNFRVRKVTLNRAAATHFALAAPASVLAETAFSFTVTALDKFDKPAVGYRGTVHFTSSDAQALMLPPDYTFTGPDNGTHTFSATLQTAGTQTITATDTAKASVSGTSNGITVGDFSLNAVSPVTLFVGGSGSAQISVNSLFGFNSVVALSVSGTTTGVTASISPSSVTPPAGGLANSTLNIGISPAIFPSTFTLTVRGDSGELTHSAVVSVTASADTSSVKNLINQMTTAGCIDSRGVSNALVSKIMAAQTAIQAGNVRTATNILNALLQQISAQSGKHIATTCTAGGTTFSPVDVLVVDIQAMIATLNANSSRRVVTSAVSN